jgi:hypothetical protein
MSDANKKGRWSLPDWSSARGRGEHLRRDALRSADLRFSHHDILPLFCPTRQRKFAKYELSFAAMGLATVHGVVFWFLDWVRGRTAFLTQKKGRLDGRPFRLTRCGLAYSAACFCGGSSAPDLWISATW